MWRKESATSAKVFGRITAMRRKVLSEKLELHMERGEKADRRTDAIVAEMKDAREESKAHRDALLALIDRLPPAQAT